MKVKVVKNFIDKETRKYNMVGTAKKPTIIDVSEERANELMEAGGYVAPVDVDENGEVVLQEEATTFVEKSTADILDDVLNGLTVVELKEHATKHNIDLNGARTKDEIIEAIKGSGSVDTASEEDGQPETQNDDGQTVDAQNDTDEVQPDQDDEFAAMKLDELKQYASDNNIALNGARTKGAIVEAIKAAR